MPASRPLVLAATLLLAACQGPPTELTVEPEPVEPGLPAYTAVARSQEQQLTAGLRAILLEVRPQVAELQAGLRTEIDGLPAPLRLATKEPFLRLWGTALQEKYQQRVQTAYGEVRDELAALYEQTMLRGEQLAAAMAPERSPLDQGATGAPLLDAGVDAFGQSLESLFDFSGMDVRLQQDVLRRDELVEIFSTFGLEGADEQLGGRLTLFLGGDRGADHPRARIVLRALEGVDAADRSFHQVVRHRVMRGSTVVHDTGWSAPGRREGVLTVELAEQYVVGSSMAPALLSDEADFEALHDMRIVTDVQTAVTDQTTRVLGGVDWQLEFRVTTRGQVSWQLSSVSPRFNPECTELRAVVADQRRLRGA